LRESIEFDANSVSSYRTRIIQFFFKDKNLGSEHCSGMQYSDVIALLCSGIIL